MSKNYNLLIFLTVTVILFVKFLIILRLTGYGLLVEWTESDTALYCKFEGATFKSIHLTDKNCIKECQTLSKCTHFWWSAEEGGICRLKSGLVKKSNATYTFDSSAFCKIIFNRTNEPEHAILYLKNEMKTNINKFTNCQFAYGRDYTGEGADSSKYDNYDYITIWINSIRTGCRHKAECTNFNKHYHGSMLKEVVKLNKTPVFYAYIIGFEAENIKFINPCFSFPPNLCQNGANFIREFRARIIERYHHYSKHIARYIGKETFCVFLIEPDFWYYYGIDTQEGGPLTGREMRELFDDIVFTIKKYLPNAAISWDISMSKTITNNQMSKWWSYFNDSKDIDFIHTSEGLSYCNSNLINPSGLKWSYMSELTGKKIIADTGSSFHTESHRFRNTWYDPMSIDKRISNGVISVTLLNSERNPRYKPRLC